VKNEVGRGHEFFNEVGIANIALVDFDLVFDVGDVGGRAGGHVVEDRDLVALGKQCITKVRTDKTGSTGDENAHRGYSTLPICRLDLVLEKYALFIFRALFGYWWTYDLTMFMRIENWCRKTSDSSFIALLLLIAIVRVGPSPIGIPWVDSVYQAARAFPTPANYIAYSPIPTLIAKLLREPAYLAWWALFGLILLFWFIAVMQKIKEIFPDHYRIVQIIFAASQVVLLEITHIGHYDNISVIGATLILFWKAPIFILIGALLAAGANPYMSFATGICVLILYLGTKNARHLKIGFIWTLTSATMLVLLHTLLNGPSSNTREDIVLNEVGLVIKGSLGVWTFILLALLGPLWFLYCWFMAQKDWSFGPVTRRRKFLVFMGTVGVPANMSFFILDHTRIGVVAGALPLFLYLLPELKFHFARMTALHGTKFPIMSVMLAVWLIYPAIIVDSGGVFRLPYAKFVALLS
jgi:hypothetical protein